MSKKEIVITVLILLGIGLLSAGGFFAWRHYETWKQSKDTQQTANATPATDSIALTNPTSAEDANSLKVDVSTSSTNTGQLGSGQPKASANSAPANSSSATQLDPTTFAAYEKYKDDKAALFGEMQVGTGVEAKDGSKVEVTYKGWLTNGTLFDESPTDSSGKTQGFVFTIGSKQVIPGFEQNVAGMKVGGTRLFIIPPAVGYGKTAQKNIPANSVLVFQVKLVNAL